MSQQLSLDLAQPERLVQLWTPDEIYDRLTSSNISEFREDRRVERKGASVQARAIGDYLSMWSNTQPHGGLIIIGMENDGKISGCRNMETSHKNDLENMTTWCPDARWASKEVPVRNFRGEEDYLLVFRVSYRPDKVVENSGGEAFIREGDKKIRVSEILKRELRISKGEIHYELEPVSIRYPDDFDASEIRKFCRNFFTNKRYQSEKSNVDLLVLAKLGKAEGDRFIPNLACALLFAKDPRDVIPGARIRVIRYEGTEERFGSELNSVYSTFIDGNIAKLLFESKPIISSQLRSFQRLSAGGRIHVRPEYPEEAWFEAVVNAVAHRSYNLKNQNIFVKIFDDKFVVESPGGFVPPTTAQTVYDAHNPRNPYLMEAMMHLELTFCGFEGTRRMRQAMKVAELPEPRFRQIEVNSHQVHVTLANDIATRQNLNPRDISNYIDENDFSKLTSDEKALLSFLYTTHEMNITSAALLIGKSWPTASKVMQSLVDSGVVEITTKRGRKHDSTKSYRLRRRVAEEPS